MAKAKKSTPTKKAAAVKKPAKKPAARPAKKSVAPKASSKAAGNIDLAAVIEQARAVAASNDDDAARLLKSAEPAVKRAPVALQVAFWEQYYEAVNMTDVREGLRTARALVACDPAAPAEVYARRLARLATAEAAVKKTDGYTTFQKALAVAPDDETRAKVLLEWVSVTHDQLTPGVALLDAFDLAKTGTLSKDLTSEVWERAAHAWPVPTSEKTRNAHDKLLASRGWASKNDLSFDACKRWLAANPTLTERTVPVVSTLCSHLFERDLGDEASKLFDHWTPSVIEQYRAGKVTDFELSMWFGSHIRNLEGAGRDAEAKKLTKQRDKLRFAD